MSKLSKKESLLERMVCAGSAACIADIVTFPFDVAKVRLQILGETVASSAKLAAYPNGTVPQYTGLFDTIFGLAKNEGIKSLYGGIGPGLQRQCVFASLRIGFYDSVKDFYTKHFNLGDNASSIMTIRILSGITTGAIAISVAQPTDVVKVRMQAQSRTTASNVTRYSSSLQAYRYIYKNEGMKGLWTGLGPNIARNSVVNAAELVCYDSIKDLLLQYKIMNDGLPCHFSAAFSAGFVATLVASPIDVVKTRFMNASVGTYSSVWDCAKCLVRGGGLLAFYKGFTPSFMRLGTWNIVMFVTFEQLKKLVNEMKEKDEAKSLMQLSAKTRANLAKGY